MSKLTGVGMRLTRLERLSFYDANWARLQFVRNEPDLMRIMIVFLTGPFDYFLPQN